MTTWVLVASAAVLLSACHRNAHGQATRVIGTPPNTDVVLSEVDLGDSVLAEVDNARLAIELRDQVAAYNDVSEALAFARQLPDRPSILLPAENQAAETVNPAGASQKAVAPVRMTAFDAVVKLGSARTEMANNLTAADAYLKEIQAGVPQQLIPGNLQLLRAAASLGLCRSAVSEGRTPELMTQLLTAQLALAAYQGPAHVAAAKALAATLAQTLKDSSAVSTLAPTQIGSWLGMVVGWTGADRWDAPRPD